MISTAGGSMPAINLMSLGSSTPGSVRFCSVPSDLTTPLEITTSSSSSQAMPQGGAAPPFNPFDSFARQTPYPSTGRPSPLFLSFLHHTLTPHTLTLLSSPTPHNSAAAATSFSNGSVQLQHSTSTSTSTSLSTAVPAAGS
jgi:hypothetical protein